MTDTITAMSEREKALVAENERLLAVAQCARNMVAAQMAHPRNGMDQSHALSQLRHALDGLEQKL